MIKLYLNESGVKNDPISAERRLTAWVGYNDSAYDCYFFVLAYAGIGKLPPVKGTPLGGGGGGVI